MKLEQIKAFVDQTWPKIQGAQLQKVYGYDEGLVLELYKFETFFLVLDLTSDFPGIYLLSDLPRRKLQTKPVSLFLSAHAKNRRLVDFEILADFGRVIKLVLGNQQKEIHIVAELIPRALNVSVTALEESKKDGKLTETKSISWNKPRELPPSNYPWNGEGSEDFNFMTEAERFQQGRLTNQSDAKAEGVKANQEIAQQKVIAKKTQALEKLLQINYEDESLRWKELGEWMKWNESPPDHLKDLYSQKGSKAEFIELCFEKAKSFARKKVGNQERIEQLQKEIAQLTQQDNHSENAALGNHKKDEVKTPAASYGLFLTKHEIKARKIDLGEEMVAFYGKSARDNLSLLRHAPPWSIWVHLKDYPSSHGLILYAKGKSVSDKIIEKVAQVLIEQEETKKNMKTGVRYSVVTTEARYVKPIKGDAIGRVTYHNARTLQFFAATQ